MSTASAHDAARTPRRRPRLLVPAGAALVLVLLASGCIINGSWTSSTPLPVPGGLAIDQVSCVSESWCLASNGSMHVWDGSTWSPAPNPPLVPYGQGVEQLDCMAVDRCLAVEFQWDEFADFDHYLLAFDGSSWTKADEVGRLGSIDPIKLSCGAGGCVVLDDSDRTITWDGSSYTQDWSTMGSVFVGTMSCTAVDECIGLTIDETKRWDGESWTIVGLGGPSSGDEGLLEPALDCPAPDRCVAIGNRFEEEEVVGLEWDGAAWTESPLPEGLDQRYADVSCRANLECMAIRGRTVITFNSQDWFASPTAPGDANTHYGDVSCAGQTCMAIGRLYAPAPPPRTGIVSRYEWTYS